MNITPSTSANNRAGEKKITTTPQTQLDKANELQEVTTLPKTIKPAGQSVDRKDQPKKVEPKKVEPKQHKKHKQHIRDAIRERKVYFVESIKEGTDVIEKATLLNRLGVLQDQKTNQLNEVEKFKEGIVKFNNTITNITKEILSLEQKFAKLLSEDEDVSSSEGNIPENI